MEERSTDPAPGPGEVQGRTRAASEADWPRLYGRRGRIGLILPPQNTTSEAEFGLYAPEGVTAHAARLAPAGATGPDAVAGAVAQARLLAPAGCDVLAYACFESSIRSDAGALAGAVEADTGLSVVTAFDAVASGLDVLGLKRLAFASPHGEASLAIAREGFAARGFEVAAARGLGIGESAEELARVGRVPRKVLTTMVADVLEEAAGAEALVIGSTDLPTLDLIAVLEDAYGIRVVTANQAMLWNVLRALGIDEINLALGELFLKPLARPHLS